MGDAAKKILLLSACNLLWGLIPWPAQALFEQYSSLTIIFARFVVMAAALVIFLIAYLVVIKIKVKGSPSLKFSFIPRYLLAHNAEFFGIAQWGYLLIVSVFGFNLMTILFFYALKTVGAITTALGVIISLVLVSAIKWGLGKEEISGFKMIYLTTLILASGILGILSASPTEAAGSKAQFIPVVLVYGVVVTFFVLSSGTDRMTAEEYRTLKNEPNYKLFRVLLKLAVLSIFAIGSFIPLLLGFRLISADATMSSEIDGFFAQLPALGDIIWSVNGAILIFGCTIFPYALYYYLSISWPKSMSFDLWVGVLQLIEPIVNLVLGVTILEEKFPLTWLGIIFFLIIISVLTKYISETQAQINAVLLLKIQPQSHARLMKMLYEIKASTEVRSLIGEFDLMVDFRFPTTKALQKVMHEKIATTAGIVRYELLIISSQDVDRAIPDEFKGKSAQHRLDQARNALR